jgi:hypothetical protein
VALAGLVFGLSQSQVWGWDSPGVLVPLVVSLAAAVTFLRVERDSPNPLMDLRLLRRHSNYLGSVLSQFVAGTAEMGLALLFPLLLILNLGMSPALGRAPAHLPAAAAWPAALRHRPGPDPDRQRPGQPGHRPGK